MLSFKREGTNVIVRIDFTTPDAGEFHIPLDWRHSGTDLASLRVDSLERQLRTKLSIIREEAYNKGWRDAKAKTTKETWFSGWW